MAELLIIGTFYTVFYNNGFLDLNSWFSARISFGLFQLICFISMFRVLSFPEHQVFEIEMVLDNFPNGVLLSFLPLSFITIIYP